MVGQLIDAANDVELLMNFKHDLPESKPVPAPLTFLQPQLAPAFQEIHDTLDIVLKKALFKN